MVVNTGVANVYREAAFQSEVVTQAILGETPQVVDQQGKWFLIRQWDGYEGWVYHFCLSKNPNFSSNGDLARVNALSVRIHEQPSDSAAAVRDAVFGTELPLLSKQGPWVQVSLPDGRDGWLRDEPLELQGTARERLVQTARRFLGVPYAWGGKTPRGFDCSGFIQTCFKAVGVHLPRDAILQYRFHDLPDIAIADARPGDLFFFSEADQRITHVAISLGGGEFIHASGWVQVESLDEGSPRCNQQLRDMFITGKDVTGLFHAGQ